MPNVVTRAAGSAVMAAAATLESPAPASAQSRRTGIDKTAELESIVAAISKSLAVIEFAMDATILAANENFLGLMGYRLEEIRGKHHRIFVDPAEQNSAAYREFWAKLNRGEYQAAEYKRFTKSGTEVWIQASYNPILDQSGKPFKVIKYASDVTAQKQSNANYAGQIEAISKSQAVVEFAMDATVLTANHNFLSLMGYTLNEVQGRKHRMFVEAAEQDSAAYQEFWAKLNRGEYQADEYKRVAKGGHRGLDPGLLQSHPRSEREAVQGGEVCHRCDRAKASQCEFLRPDCCYQQVAGGGGVRHGCNHPDGQR